MNPIIERLNGLRAELKLKNVEAIIVPSNDPHFSEYPAGRWKYRKWLSGFSGSAGTLVVTMNNAALWVDSRYFIQAKKQLNGSCIEMQKQQTGMIDENWIKEKLGNESKVGVDASLFSVNQFNSLKESLAPLSLVDIGDIFDNIYTDRPVLPENEAFLLSEEITGKSRKEKISDFVNKLLPNNEIYIISALDEIAWLLNMRGSDVSFNPVAISYLVIDYPEIHLFIGTNQINGSNIEELEKDGVKLHPYIEFGSYLSDIPQYRTVKFDFNKINYHIYKTLIDAGVPVIEDKDFHYSIALKKSVKNITELAGFRKCMVTDGVAMIRFLKWMQENIGKNTVTEIDAANKLEEFRKEGKDYKGLSFSTISAYKGNGALPHYHTTPKTNAEIKKSAFYLVDSGAQYLTGTTDLTRTIHYGNPTDEEKEDYTLVLKGMINLSMAKFPAGTRGSQLDILARKFLWEKGKNFLHGTGHGVGHYLNVHEGPQSIRMNENPVPMIPGMVTSNEPAVYIEGKYGIRIENLIACKYDYTTEFGDFYSFETLTLCPIETKPIDMSLMAKEEIEWLNSYHNWVYNILSSYLNEEEMAYLKEKTAAI